MSVKNIISTAIVLVTLAVSGMAQTIPTQASPAHPFLGSDVAPQSNPQVTPKASPDPQVVPSAPATPVPAVAPDPAPATAAPTPAQPGKSPAVVPPVPAAATPGPLQIITDPRAIQQLFGRQTAAPTSPTPEMLESVYQKVWQQVAEQYHDPARLANWYQWQDKYKGKLTTPDELEAAVKEMLKSLRDPWTKYISTTEIKKQQSNAQNGISDLGIWLVQNPDGSYKIDYTTFGTPSYASAMHKGDELKSAGGKALKGLSQEEAEALLSGKDGSKIEVVYVRNGQEHKETLTVAPAAAGVVVANLLPGNIAYIRFPAFDNESFPPFVQALMGLYAQSNGNLNGLILDLRGNSGGLVTLAQQVAQIFIEKGPIFTSTTRGQGRMLSHETFELFPPQKHDFAGAPPEAVTMIKDFYKVPMVVLVNGSSASSSEIVTGALKDSGRATVVGTTTYGKGVGYNMGRIPPGGVLYITTLNYLTPSGYNLSDKGIPAQIVVERTPGVKVDEQLAKAIEVLKAQNPDQFADPNSASKKKLGEDGDWTSNPVAIAGVVALFLLLIVLSARNHVLANRRRKDEAKRDTDSE
jgi:carboxyl-terminal processing protease